MVTNFANLTNPQPLSIFDTILGSTISASQGAGAIGFNPALNYAANTIGWVNLQNAVNLQWFTGADNTGATDMTSLMLTAATLKPTIYLPAGTWAMNWTATKPFTLVGEGSQKSIIKPFSTATAAVTYNPNPTAPYWTYHSLVDGLGFASSSNTGIGFTFGASSQANYVAGMEFANNVVFRRCRFSGFNKGVQAPFGNIGCEFYSCGFTSNYYGCYFLDNKNYPATPGSALMHAGNKYFFGGEIDNNVCGVYIHNASDGYGGVVFNGTILESNSVNVYEYTNNTYQPTAYNDVWSESSGALFNPSNVTLDQWTGSTLSTASFAPHAYIFDGSNHTIKFSGGFVTDINLIATNTRVLARESRVETQSSFSGGAFSVANAQSLIVLENPETNGSVGTAARTFVTGNFKPRNYDITSGFNSSRVFRVYHRYNKLAGSYGGSGTVDNLTVASNLGNGSFSVTAGTASDGIIYGTCNTYSAPFTLTSQFTALQSSIVALAAATWYVVTFNVKVTSGTPTFNSWDRSTNQIFTVVSIPETGVWYTVAAIGYSPGSVATFYALDIGCSTGVTAVFRLSAFQIRGFATEAEAQAFLQSGVYVGP